MLSDITCPALRQRSNTASERKPCQIRQLHDYSDMQVSTNNIPARRTNIDQIKLLLFFK